MVMTGYQFDLITIGAGSGGVAASRRAGSYGAKVALCEFDRVGGTCVLRGCVPKKLLVYASHVAEELRDAAGFGWTIGETSHDWPALIAAKDRELDRLNQAYLRMLGDAGVAVHYGRARLRDAIRAARRIKAMDSGPPEMPTTTQLRIPRSNCTVPWKACRRSMSVPCPGFRCICP